jgi:hypothetical protein
MKGNLPLCVGRYICWHRVGSVMGNALGRMWGAGNRLPLGGWWHKCVHLGYWVTHSWVAHKSFSYTWIKVRTRSFQWSCVSFIVQCLSLARWSVSYLLAVHTVCIAYFSHEVHLHQPPYWVWCITVDNTSYLELHGVLLHLFKYKVYSLKNNMQTFLLVTLFSL